MPLMLVRGHAVPDRRGSTSWNKGRREVWAGSWGLLSDRRSRLAKLAERIERMLRREHVTSRPLYRLRIAEAARFAALGQAMLADVGIDPKASPARALKLTNASARLLRDIPKRPPRKREEDLAAALRRQRPGA